MGGIIHGRPKECVQVYELLQRGGAYRKLYRDQFGDGEIETRCADAVVFTDGRHRLHRTSDLPQRAASLRRRLVRS